MLPAIFIIGLRAAEPLQIPSAQSPVQDSIRPANDDAGWHQNSASLTIGHKPANNLTKTHNKWKRNTP